MQVTRSPQTRPAAVTKPSDPSVAAQAPSRQPKVHTPPPPKAADPVGVVGREGTAETRASAPTSTGSGAMALSRARRDVPASDSKTTDAASSDSTSGSREIPSQQPAPATLDSRFAQLPPEKLKALQERTAKVAEQQQTLADAAPSYGKTSSAYMKSFVKERLQKDIDPDHTYLNEYVPPHTSVNAVGGPYNIPRQDGGKFLNSRPLSQVAIDNISDPLGLHFQTGEKNYRISDNNDPTKKYGEQRDVIEPQAFYKSLGNLDFMGHYKQKIDSYYQDNATALRQSRQETARLEIDTQHAIGQLGDDDRRLALRGIDGDKGAQLAADEDTDREGHTSEADTQRLKDYRSTGVYPLDVNGRESHDSLRIEDKTSGRTLLYMPGESQPVQAFDNGRQASEWLIQQSRTPGWSRDFANNHFPANDAQGRTGGVGVTTTLDREVDRRDRPTNRIGLNLSSPASILQSQRDIREDAFGALNYIARDGQQKDARYDITSNSDVNKENLRKALKSIPIPLVSSVPGLFLAKTPAQFGDSATQFASDVITLGLPESDTAKPVTQTIRNEIDQSVANAATHGIGGASSVHPRAGTTQANGLLGKLQRVNKGVGIPMGPIRPPKWPTPGENPSDLKDVATPPPSGRPSASSNSSPMASPPEENLPPLQAPASGAWQDKSPSVDRPAGGDSTSPLAQEPPPESPTGLLSPQEASRASWSYGAREPAWGTGTLRGVERGPLANVDGGPEAVQYDLAHGTWTTVYPEQMPLEWNEGRGSYQVRHTPVSAARPESQASVLREFGFDGLPTEYPQPPASPGPEVPRQIQQIWMGDPENLIKQARIINANQALAAKTGYTINMHMLPDAGLTPEMTARLRKEMPGVKFQNMQEEKFFQEFRQSKYYEPFKSLQADTSHRNLAAASDLLRYPLMDSHPGLYIDTDDALTSQFGREPLRVRQGELGLGKPVDNGLLGMNSDFNNSQFATQGNNPLLKEIQEEGYRRFMKDPAMFLERPHGRPQTPAESQAMSRYMTQISETVGPGLLNDVVRRRPAYRAFLDATKDRSALQGIGIYGYDTKGKEAATRYYAPLSGMVSMGGAASWMTTR